MNETPVLFTAEEQNVLMTLLEMIEPPSDPDARRALDSIRRKLSTADQTVEDLRVRVQQTLDQLPPGMRHMLENATVDDVRHGLRATREWAER